MATRLGWRAGLGLALTAAAALGSCTRDADGAGAVRLQLRTQVAGVAYRLRAATFTVTPVGGTTPATTIATEDDPDAPLVQRTLPPGDYSVQLGPGWRLEKQFGGAFQPVTTTLASQNPFAFTIASGQATPVAFAFQTDGSLVVFGDGTLELSIQVTDTSLLGFWDVAASLWDTALWQ